MAEPNQSAGVEELIQRLREEGVSAGQSEAARLFEETRARAEELLEQARRQADEILHQARQEAGRTTTAGEEALRLAKRDAVLSLKAELVDHLKSKVQRLVSHSLADEQFLQRLILEVAARVAPKDSQSLEILLSDQAADFDELQKDVDENKEGTLGHFVHALAADTLREGVSLTSGSDDKPGIRIRIVNEDVEIDLTDEAISELLLQHLLPRYRILLEGVVE